MSPVQSVKQLQYWKRSTELSLYWQHTNGSGERLTVYVMLPCRSSWRNCRLIRFTIWSWNSDAFVTWPSSGIICPLPWRMTQWCTGKPENEENNFRFCENCQQSRLDANCEDTNLALEIQEVKTSGISMLHFWNGKVYTYPQSISHLFVCPRERVMV